MLGKKIGTYWRLCWGFITPVLMLIILVYSVAIMQPETYHDEPFPSSVYGKKPEISYI
jgi:solute carrier family 6 amino acid transporter-like protein 5/7/9/14